MKIGDSPFYLHRFGTRFGTPGMPKVLWLHGFLGAGTDIEPCLGPLREDFEFLCPDLPGHGQSAPMSLSETLSGIARLAAGCAFSAGYSMGGRLLMMSAARYPDDFGHLVLESAFTGYADEKDRAARRELDRQRAERLKSEGLEAFCRWWYAQPMWHTLPSPPVRHGNAEDLARALETFSAGNQPDLLPWLKHCCSRILWLAGERDTSYMEQAHCVERHVSRAQVRIFPDCGHNLHLEAPAQWQSALQNFLTAIHQQEQ